MGAKGAAKKAPETEGMFIMKTAFADVGVYGSVALDSRVTGEMVKRDCNRIASGDKLLRRRLLTLCAAARQRGCAEIRFENRGRVGGYDELPAGCGELITGINWRAKA